MLIFAFGYLGIVFTIVFTAFPIFYLYALKNVLKELNQIKKNNDMGTRELKGTFTNITNKSKK